MKKLLIIPVAILFLFQFSYAAKISLQDTQIFRINQGSVNLLPITITADQDNEITASNGINILLQADYDIRLDANSLKNLSFSGAASGKVDYSGIYVKPDLLSLHIPLKESFKSQDTLVLSGLNVIVYSRARGAQPLLLDINNDGVSDVTDNAGISIQNVEVYRDITPPNEIFNLSGRVDGNSLYLQWTNPGDIDFQVAKVQTLDNNKSLLKEDYRFNSNQATVELNSNIKYLNFQTIDERNNMSTGLLVDINTFTSPIIVTTGSSNTGSSNTGNFIIYTGSTSNASTGSSDLSTGNQSVNTGNVNQAVKYMPSFSRALLTDFMNKFDIVINNKIVGFSIESSNSVIGIRNEIISTLEGYDKNRLTSDATVLKLKELIVKFNNALNTK